MQTRSQGMRLCKWCRTLNLDAIFQRKHCTDRGGPVRQRKRAGREFSVDSCPLCRLIAHTFGDPAGELRGNDYQLYSYSSSRINSGGWAAIDTIMLSLQDKTRFHGRDFSREMRFLVPQVQADKPIRIIPPLVSASLLREWVTRCLEGHDKLCGLAADAMAPLSEISSFRTIDCRTGKLVPWIGQPYATLSYVWGGEPAPLFTAALDIPQLPPTIQDTIALTVALGIGHLWIDRYCISQQSDAEKAEQLPKMDLIYNLSEVTIINADGEGTKLGLAGMMGQPRKTRQPQTRIGTRLLASTPRHASFDIRTSIWWSRGWTYQEGVLARRRVVFTQGQVYYECGGMYCCEALNFDLDALHTLDGQRFKAQYYRRNKNTDKLALFKSVGLGGSAWDVTRRIQEYSGKALREEDVLDGIRGVLGAMERGRWRLRHLWGVPVLPRGPRPTGRRSEEMDEYKEAYDSITWTPTIGLCAGLCWRGESRLERRADFPSWSWTGWK
ncbi:heterokaryon incompatibility protein-domain-containing protein, partial [Lasiosphaeris hirsuta]